MVVLVSSHLLCILGNCTHPPLHCPVIGDYLCTPNCHQYHFCATTGYVPVPEWQPTAPGTLCDKDKTSGTWFPSDTVFTCPGPDTGHLATTAVTTFETTMSQGMNLLCMQCTVTVL